MKNPKWIVGLDSLRFFLALIVVLSHMENPVAMTLKDSHQPALHILGMILTPLWCGIAAVIVFFVISGFVIHYPNKNKEVNYPQFLARRWSRVVIPMIVIGGIAIYFNLFFELPMWSLYCELIYYTLYPLFMFLFKKKINWTIQFWVAFGISLVVILLNCKEELVDFKAQANVYYTGQYWRYGVQLTWLLGLPCWLLGVKLAEEIDAIKIVVSRNRLVLMRILVFALSSLTYVLRFRFHVSWIFTMNLFAFVVYPWLRDEIVYYRTHKPVAFFEGLGKFSYSLYLNHPLAVRLLMNYYPLTIYTYIPYIVITIAMAYILYLLVERPSHKLAQKIIIVKR